MDLSSAISAALANVVDDFQTNIAAVIPALLGLAVATLIVRRVVRFIR